MRYDWKALRDLYVRADELTLGTLAADAGLNADRIAERAQEENWELTQPLYRQRMGIPQKSAISARTWAEFDESCNQAWKAVAAALERELEVHHDQDEARAIGERRGKTVNGERPMRIQGRRASGSSVPFCPGRFD